MASKAEKSKEKKKPSRNKLSVRVSMKKQSSLKSPPSSPLEISSDDLLRRSLRRRNSKSFGCVSGLLHFLSTTTSHSSKSITFVHTQNQELEDSIPPPPKPESAADCKISCSDSDPQISGRSESGMWRLRGPIVRLMGLEEAPATEAEKQREVMAALEKCERDLKALKEFIDSSDSFRSSAPAGEGKKIEFLGWEPSPVSLRHFVNTTTSANPERAQLPQRQDQLQRKNPREEDAFNLNKIDKIKTNEELVGKCKNELLSPLCSSSKAIMRDIVEGVSKDIAWGQKREVERIVLALQHQIFADLIEELVKDSIFSYSFSYSSLPFEACKRRLCF